MQKSPTFDLSTGQRSVSYRTQNSVFLLAKNVKIHEMASEFFWLISTLWSLLDHQL